MQGLSYKCNCCGANLRKVGKSIYDVHYLDMDDFMMDPYDCI